VDITPSCALKFQVKPSVTEDSLQVALYGKVLTEEVSQFTAAKFVEAPSDEAMVVALISDAAFNDVAFQAFTNKKLEFTLNKRSPPLLYSLLSLKCDKKKNETCLGTVAPALADKYGADADVEASFKAVRAPEIEFIKNKAIFKGGLKTELTITRAKDEDKPEHEATASVELTGALIIKIVDGVLHAKISMEDDDIVVKIDEVHNQKWQDKIRGIIRQAVEKHVNDLLMRGVDLKKKLFGASLKDPKITIDAHTLQIQSAFDMVQRTSSEASKEN